MNRLTRMLDLLPPPYSVAADSLLSRLLEIAAAELEALDEDIDRMRQTHWIGFCSRLADAEKLGALMGIAKLPWETLPLYRSRLIATVKARLLGALGPNEIRKFVHDYLAGVELATNATLVHGLASKKSADDAFRSDAERPHFIPLALIENPDVRRESAALRQRNGNVPYLLRWRESNGGLADTSVRIHITGAFGRKTAVPVLLNITTGEMIGYCGRLDFGQELLIEASGSSDNPLAAKATIAGADVTKSLFGISGFRLGEALTADRVLDKPNMPRLLRGINEWLFLCIGHFDIKGLDSYFFALAGENFQEGVFDESRFDSAVFPSGTMANLAMDWFETEPAVFEVHVPRSHVREPRDSGVHRLAQTGLDASIAELRAAGVESRTRYLPFTETQGHRAVATLPWVVLAPEQGSAGERISVALGGQFGESALGGTRFE
jgi:hypothetical protein